MLTAEQRASWEREGYLAIAGFFPEAEIDRITALVEKIFRDPPRYLAGSSRQTLVPQHRVGSRGQAVDSASILSQRSLSSK